MTEFKQDDLLIKLENIFKIYQTGEAAVHALEPAAAANPPV